jgi:hypothetical protein
MYFSTTDLTSGLEHWFEFWVRVHPQDLAVMFCTVVYFFPILMLNVALYFFVTERRQAGLSL